MKIDRKGVTRIVFIFRHFVIKIPNFNHCHQHFLQGCYANWSERVYCKRMKGVEGNKFYNKVAPSFWCSWFGLIQIQAKCTPVLRHLTDEEIEHFKDLHGGDYKKENFGWYKGRLVCLDYT